MSRNIKKMSVEKERIIRDIDQVSAASGAIMVSVKKEMEDLEQRAKVNIEKLSFLL